MIDMGALGCCDHLSYTTDNILQGTDMKKDVLQLLVMSLAIPLGGLLVHS